MGLLARGTFSVLLWAVLQPAVASAQPAEEGDSREEARAHAEDAVRHFRNREYAEAREAFEEAYRVLPNPRLFANIAACHVGEERWAEAVRAYRRFLAEAGRDAPAAARRRVEREIARLRSLVGDLAVAVDVEGADVLVDGASVGSAPLPGPIAVTPGLRTLEVRSPDYVPFTRTIEVDAGQEVNLSVVLQRRARESEGAGRAAARESASRAPPREDRTPIGRGPLLWVGVGLTAALAIGGTVTGLVVVSKSGEYEDPNTSLARRHELYDDLDTLTLVTDVLVDAAVVVGLATATLYLFGGPSEERSERVALRRPEVRFRGAHGEGDFRCELRWAF